MVLELELLELYPLVVGQLALGHVVDVDPRLLLNQVGDLLGVLVDGPAEDPAQEVHTLLSEHGPDGRHGGGDEWYRHDVYSRELGMRPAGGPGASCAATSQV